MHPNVNMNPGATMKKILPALLLCVAGCAVTSDELRKDPGRVLTFTIDRDYQRVYRALLVRARHCNTSAYGAVFGDIFPEKRQGEIAITLFTMGGEQRTVVLMDIESFNGDQTRVKATLLHKAALLDYESQYLAWANELNYQCFPATKSAE